MKNKTDLTACKIADLMLGIAEKLGLSLDSVWQSLKNFVLRLEPQPPALDHKEPGLSL